MAQQTPSTVTFYPSQEYFDKNWAGQEVPLDSLRALAKSQAFAEHTGMLDSDTTKYYLPSALTENRWADYGVNQVDINNRTAPAKEWNTISNARDAAVLKALKSGKINPDEYKSFKKWGDINPEKVPGLDRLNELFYGEQFWPSTKVPDRTNALRQKAYQLGFDTYRTEVMPNQGSPGYGKYDVYNPIPDQTGTDILPIEDYHKNAALKTLALLNRQDETGKSGLDLWEKYNGSGPEAKRYKRRVSEAYDIMNHPKNRDMWNAYNNMVNQYRLELKHGKR